MELVSKEEREGVGGSGWAIKAETLGRAGRRPVLSSLCSRVTEGAGVQLLPASGGSIASLPPPATAAA